MLAPITSRKHDVVKRLRKLGRRTYRDRGGTFLVEGLNLLQEAIGSGARLRELAYVESRAEEAAYLKSRLPEQIPTHELSPELMAWISDVVTAQGIVGVVDQVDVPYGEISLSESTLLLVADQVRDPGNLGSLMRIADACGLDAVLVTEGSVDIYNPKVVRSAAGAHFHLKVARGIALSMLREDTRGRFRLMGLEPRGDIDYLEADMASPVALVVGNEAFGIVEEDRRLLDDTVFIEMPGRAESLNVASAAAVVLFEALRQRRRGRESRDA